MAGRREKPFRGAGDRLPLAEGELRLLSAWEVLEARREGLELAGEGGERALCADACLVAKALTRKGRPVYSCGRQVLESLRVEEIVRLADRWGEFNRARNPSPLDGGEETERRKKAWSTRLTRAFNGACSACSARFPRRRGRGK